MDAKSAQEILVSGLVAGVLVAAILWWYHWAKKRESAMLQKWAEQNGFEILLCDPREISGAGPFPYWKHPKQPVYFVRVRDKQGAERSGWVMFGSFWGGTWDSDKAEVSWANDRESTT
jgi:hypothetical protein